MNYQDKLLGMALDEEHGGLESILTSLINWFSPSDIEEFCLKSETGEIREQLAIYLYATTDRTDLPEEIEKTITELKRQERI